MSALETGDASRTNNPNNSFPIGIISELRFPLHSSMRIVFTGYFNGFNVEINSVEEIALLYHMGFFGKGSASRSRPNIQNDDVPSIMRKRQYSKRNFWYKKFGGILEQSDEFLKEVEDLTATIIADGKNVANKDVIDLVTSDEDNEPNIDEQSNLSVDKKDLTIIVPNSDSEGENYFENLKPKCCVNNIKLQEKLMLTLQEAFFLLYGLGCLQIYVTENRLLTLEQCWKLFIETDKSFVSKYVVYHYYRSKGYIVKPGIKFGGDYLLYKEGPGINHADYIVVIKYKEEKLHSNWSSTLGHMRMAATTVKEILVVEVIENIEELSGSTKDLHNFRVRETLMTRHIPATINDDVD